MPAPDAHVLVVDDDRDARETVAAALETDGYHVRCAGNGAQALAALLHERKPEAVILELSMPVMTGWELLATVHEDRDLQGIPFVVVSAMRAPAGVEHLDKPVSLRDLVTTLDRLCRH
jgi:two-component system response regulator (stage 0 sporulation protein F)